MTTHLSLRRQARVFAGLSVACYVTLIAASAQPYNFLSIQNMGVPVYGGTTAWADYNADGNVDLLLTGRTTEVGFGQNPELVTVLYRHLGITPSLGGPRHLVFSQQFAEPVWLSDAAWGDYDNDGDLDLLLAGATRTDEPYEPVARLYRFDGGFPLTLAASFPGVYGAAAAWADFDNDGDLDFVLSGVQDTGEYVTRLYRNKDESFIEIPDALPNVAYGDIAWGDYDLDGDLDLLIAGLTNGQSYVGDVFRNDGNDTFTPLRAGFQGLAHGTVAWGDMDNDGDLDVAMNGGNLGFTLFDAYTRIYRNEGNDRFAPVTTALENAALGGIIWADIDNDGQLDLVQSGIPRPLGSYESGFYRNQNGVLQRWPNPCASDDCGPLAKVAAGAPAVFDIDRDYDLDLSLTGRDREGSPFFQLYIDDVVNIPQKEQPIVQLNAPPSAPGSLQATMDGSTVRFSWGPGTDDTTPSKGLTYSVRVGRSPGGAEVLSPAALASDGTRQLPEAGNAGPGRMWHLKNLSPGTYYWSVQSIDHSYAGSPFAQEATFTIQP